MMARRPEIQRQNWFDPKFITGMVISVAGGLIAIGVIYATFNSKFADNDKRFDVQDKRFESYEKKLDAIMTAIDEAKKKSATIGATDLAEREKVRAEFLVRADKTNDSLAELNKRIAVAETIQVNMSTTLNKIADQLAVAIGGPAPNGGRHAR